MTLSDRLAHNERERHRLEQLIHDLTPWEPLRLQISAWQGTAHATLFAGIVPASEGSEIRQLLRDAVTEVTVEEVSPRGTFQAWMVIAHVSVVDEVRLALAGTSFSEVRFAGLTDYPAEEMAKAREHIVQLDQETAELTERVRELSKSEYEHAVALVQALESQRERIAVLRDVAVTQSAFVISGWLPEVREPDEGSTRGFEGDVDVTLSGVGEDDNPPVSC